MSRFSFAFLLFLLKWAAIVHTIVKKASAVVAWGSILLAKSSIYTTLSVKKRKNLFSRTVISKFWFFKASKMLLAVSSRLWLVSSSPYFRCEA